MLEDILIDRHISVYKLSQQSQIPYSTLQDLKSGKTSPDNISSGCLRAIAMALDMTMDATYEQLSQTTLRHVKTQKNYPISNRLRSKIKSLRIIDEQHKVEGIFQIQDPYHVNIKFQYNEKEYTIPFNGLVTNQRLHMLETLGYLTVQEFIEQLEFNTFVESIQI